MVTVKQRTPLDGASSMFRMWTRNALGQCKGHELLLSRLAKASFLTNLHKFGSLSIHLQDTFDSWILTKVPLRSFWNLVFGRSKNIGFALYALFLVGRETCGLCQSVKTTLNGPAVKIQR